MEHILDQCHCGDGANHLICNALNEIEAIYREKYKWRELANSVTEYGAGWHDLIIEMIGNIEEIYKKNNGDISEFKINQIKEKYGGLKFM